MRLSTPCYAGLCALGVTSTYTNKPSGSNPALTVVLEKIKVGRYIATKTPSNTLESIKNCYTRSEHEYQSRYAVHLGIPKDQQPTEEQQAKLELMNANAKYLQILKAFQADPAGFEVKVLEAQGGKGWNGDCGKWGGEGEAVVFRKQRWARLPPVNGLITEVMKGEVEEAMG